MRQIEFRGKRKDNGEWVYGFYTEVTSYPNKEHYISTSKGLMKIIPETVGQFTGLTDKNGKKIYEGDLCKVDISRYDSRIKNRSYAITDVRWYDSGLILSGVTQDLWETGRIEVIGSIHDNPELID